MSTPDRRSPVLGTALFLALFAVPNPIRSQAPVHIEVNDPRPLAAAATALEDHFGIPINYEDIPYAYSGDIADRTDEVNSRRTAAQKAAVPESEFKFMDARGGQLSFDSEALPTVASVSQILQALVSAHVAKGFPGIYTANFIGTAFFITPTQMRDASGKWKPVTPILDTKITLPSMQRTLEDTLNAIGAQASKGTGIPFRCCLGVQGNLMLAGTRVGAENEPARNVIARLLSTLHPQNPQKLEDGSIVSSFSYQLQFDPQFPAYYLKLRLIHPTSPPPPEARAPQVRRATPIPGRTPSSMNKEK